jgi:hypothetical protein
MVVGMRFRRAAAAIRGVGPGMGGGCGSARRRGGLRVFFFFFFAAVCYDGGFFFFFLPFEVWNEVVSVLFPSQ